MKHKLIKYLPKGIAVVTAGTMLFSVAKSCKQDNLDKPKNQEVIASVPVDLHKDEKIKEIEKDLYKEPEEAMLRIFDKSKINNLLDNHFKDIDKSNILISVLESEDTKVSLRVKIDGIYNISSFVTFFEELNQKFNISVLEIESELLIKLKHLEFENTEKLIINNSEDFIGQANLRNFKNLKKLVLNQVNVDFFPSSVEEITFNGHNHSQYFIGNEIASLKNNNNLCLIEINNVNIANIKIPAIKNVYLKFIDCEGYINLFLENTENIFIINDNFETYSNIIVINGSVSNKMYIVSNSSNIFKGNLTGNPLEVFVIKFPEGDYIKKLNNIEVLEQNESRKRSK